MRKRIVAAAAALTALGGVVAAYAVLGPQPEKQARRDGCGRSRQDEFVRLAPGWAYVNDADYPQSGPPPPPRWLTGVVRANGRRPLDSHPSGGDDPTTHDAFDFNFNVLPDPEYADLLAGDPEVETGNFEGEGEETGRLHVERELTALPQFAWPERGDRVALMGSWVWDCGHWDPGGERAEIHPYRALWVQRAVSRRTPYADAEGDLYISTDATPAGVMAECSHRYRGDREAYRICTRTQPNWLDVGGEYDLGLPVPPKPAGATRLVVRVVDKGSTVAVRRPQLEPGRARLRFRLTATPTQRLVLAEQVFVGWRPGPRLDHLRITFTRVLTRRSMDPVVASRPEPQSRLDQQIAKPPGEWMFYSDVSGLWKQWPQVIPARDGRVFPLRVTQDVFLPRGKPWRLLIWPHECDFGNLSWTNPVKPMLPCPKTREFGNFRGDDLPGLIVVRFRSPAASIGMHAVDASNAPPSTCPGVNRRGCYRLRFDVRRVR